MISSKWRSFWIGFGGSAAVVAVVAVIVFWPESGETVTREALQRARQVWRQAGILDYDLDLRTSGAREGSYHVEVRGGAVRKITIDGRTADPKEAGYYSVEGLFLIVEEELDNAERGVPAPGKDVWLWMKTDPQLGYPVRFIRQVSGTAQGITLDVLKFERR